MNQQDDIPAKGRPTGTIRVSTEYAGLIGADDGLTYGYRAGDIIGDVLARPLRIGDRVEFTILPRGSQYPPAAVRVLRIV
jgi:hypothetical protein